MPRRPRPHVSTRLVRGHARPIVPHTGAPVVVGTGFVALDIVQEAADTVRRHHWAGGTCGNVLAILAYFGWGAYPVARLNGDAAGHQVRDDLARWGVRLDFTKWSPAPDTPIIVQTNYRDAAGTARHRYSWLCPNCGSWLPRYRPIRADAARDIAVRLPAAQVFFFDRVSRGTLLLAQSSAARGALVMFEPSGPSDEALFAEALSIAHVVKYAHDRLPPLEVPLGEGGPLLEIRTLGRAGLQYRGCLAGCSDDWKVLPGFAIDMVHDTAGAGDWCTATLLDHLARTGADGLRAADKRTVEDALCQAQASAAWNCLFPGARGAMYACTWDEVRIGVDRLLDGEQIHLPSAGLHVNCRAVTPQAPICPACTAN